MTPVGGVYEPKMTSLLNEEHVSFATHTPGRIRIMKTEVKRLSGCFIHDIKGNEMSRN
jgi:hypothetical protein